MFEEIRIKYIHLDCNLGIEDIRNVWLLAPVPVKLTTTIHQGNLFYRMPVSGKRISYRTLKKGLIKKQLVIKIPFRLLSF